MDNDYMKLKKALRDCVETFNNSSFPEKQCAINRARMLLEELDRKERRIIRIAQVNTKKKPVESKVVACAG